nr:HEAT repeat domain-containing protein [Acidobacteriota bacterium]
MDENQLAGLLIELSETVRQNAVYKSFVSPSASLVDREQTAQVESLIIHQDLPDRLVELVRPTKTVLVLGGPGSGKTTLSMMLTEAATRLSPALLPIPIDVQTLMQAETREQVIRESVPGVPEEVIQQLDTGQRLLLLIDGLNEIEHSRTVGERARNVALSMVTGRERNAVLATSRVPVPSLFKGRGIFGARDTVEVVLLPFDDDQIRALIARYPQIHVGEFDEYLDTGQLRSLASNPQLLSMLITIFLGKRETAVGPGEVPAPHSVSELFDLFFDTKWSEKAPLVSQPDVGRLTFQRALSSLAWHARLHGLPAVPKEQWADLLSPFDHLIGRDGLSRQTIIDRASALYLMELRARGLSFIHERFLDYFAARFLHELGWIPESFWNLREWEQTLSFLAGMKDADGFLFLLDQSIRRNRTSLACQMAAANFGRLRTENLHDVFQLVATSLYGPRPRRDDAVQGLREFPISDAIDSLRQTLPDIPVTDRQSINRAIELMRLSRLTPESFQNARRRAERRLRESAPRKGRSRPTVRYGTTSHNELTATTQDLVLLTDIDAPDYKRGAAATRLGTRGRPVALEPLINALKDEAPGVRGSAATALAALGDRRAVEPLIAALKDEADNVRGSAATALAALGDRRAVEPLINALKDEASGVRGSAATALAALGDRRAVEPLINALQDDAPGVRGSAARALAALGDRG